MVLTTPLLLSPATTSATNKPQLTPAQEADECAKLGKAIYDKEQFAAAAELYRRAFRLYPAKPDYLYGVGRSEQRAGRYNLAKVAFQQLLALIPTDDPLAARARKALAEIAEVLEPPKEREDVVLPRRDGAAQPEPKQPVIMLDVPHSNTAQSRVPAMTALGFGVVGLVVGGTFGVLAQQADRAADDYRVPGERAFDPAKTTEAAARAQVADIQQKWMVAAVGGGVGLAGAVLAAVLWPKANVSAGTDGVTLRATWRF